MNDKLKAFVNHTDKSLYRISHETGIPYTILNELMNDKKNINKISSETVYKLCLYFDCSISDIINPFPFLKNSQGTYMGVKYKWLPFRQGIELHIYIEKEDVILTQIEPVIPRWYNYYQNEILEMLISSYLRKRKIKEELL